MVSSADTFARTPPSLEWVPWLLLAEALRFPDLHWYYEVLRLLRIFPFASGLP